MRLIDGDKLKKEVLKWLPSDPCGVEEKEIPFETDIVVSVLMEIEEAPTIEQPTWTPCSERLPKIDEHHISEPCIVYCKNGVYAFAELEENIFGQVGWNCERDDDYHEPIGEVVAWMPLTEPYHSGEATEMVETTNYEQASDQRDYDSTYEPTYNEQDGSM